MRRKRPQAASRRAKGIMTAAEFEQLTEEQVEELLAHRFCYLSEAGYPPASALVIAARPEIALSLAASLLCERGIEAPFAGASEPRSRMAAHE